MMQMSMNIRRKGSETMKAIAVFVCMLATVSVTLAGMPPVPPTPVAVDDIVYARPFTLEQGFKYCWNKEGPTVASGTLLVLKVADKNLVLPRQCAEPVLYVGQSTAQRINFGHQSGYVVALVPGAVDLTKAPVWFGQPDLPERVTSEMINTQRSLADQAGIKPFAAKKVKAALAEGGEQLQAKDMSELLRTEVAELILKYSPQEKHLADNFRTPVVTLPKPSED
jgi:hypothetical protein